MDTEEILLLRVGLDSGSGRGHAPLFADDSFEYVPIPESSETTEARTYDDLPARTGGHLSKHAPHLAERVPHFDPEFESFTYGDPGRNKRSQLSRLTTDDLLIFYSSLEPADVDAGPRLCVIGYFVVDTVYDLEAMSPAERDAAFKRVENNAHVKRTGLTRETPHREYYPVVVKGDPERSRLLDRPIPLGSGDRTVLPWVAEIIGFERDLTRAGVARVLDADNAAEIRRWLALGSDFLVGEDAKLRTHATVSAGFTPSVTGERCALAAGAPAAQVGDWIAVTVRSDGEERLTHLLRVDETVSRDAYRRDERFEASGSDDVPRDGVDSRVADGLTGETAAARQSDDADRRHDPETDRVPVGSPFWYFGEDGVSLPERLRRSVRRRRGADAGRPDSSEDGETLRELVLWVSLRFDPGVNVEGGVDGG